MASNVIDVNYDKYTNHVIQKYYNMYTVDFALLFNKLMHLDKAEII